jgi:hypothetical protein
VEVENRNGKWGKHDFLSLGTGSGRREGTCEVRSKVKAKRKVVMGR